jgi:hypothetical protein
MNERVQALAKQAGLESFYIEYSPWQVEFEKFANLIVNKCCQKLEDDGCVEIAIELKQHFGVE